MSSRWRKGAFAERIVIFIADKHPLIVCNEVLSSNCLWKTMDWSICSGSAR